MPLTEEEEKDFQDLAQWCPPTLPLASMPFRYDANRDMFISTDHWGEYHRGIDVRRFTALTHKRNEK